MTTAFKECVQYLLDNGVSGFDYLDTDDLDILLLHHFEDKKAVIDEIYLEEFLLESLVEKTPVIFDVLMGEYSGIKKALREYSSKYGILEELWEDEVQRLECRPEVE